MKHFIYLLLFLTACESSNIDNEKKVERPEVESKKAEVMAIHDFAMEKMGEMVKLKAALKEKKIDSTQTKVINQAIQDLEDADKLMWDWMHGYKAQIVDTSSTEIALEYLVDQKIKVDIVNIKIKESLKNGYELLEK